MSTQVLDCPMDPNRNDARASTIREYLAELLKVLWAEGDGFSGKRPFGNSGWEWDIYTALVDGGFVTGTVDSDGYLDEVDTAEADRLVHEAITTLRTASAAEPAARPDGR